MSGFLGAAGHLAGHFREPSATHAPDTPDRPAPGHETSTPLEESTVEIPAAAADQPRLPDLLDQRTAIDERRQAAESRINHLAGQLDLNPADLYSARGEPPPSQRADVLHSAATKAAATAGPGTGTTQVHELTQAVHEHDRANSELSHVNSLIDAVANRDELLITRNNLAWSLGVDPARLSDSNTLPQLRADPAHAGEQARINDLERVTKAHNDSVEHVGRLQAGQISERSVTAPSEHAPGTPDPDLTDTADLGVLHLDASPEIAEPPWDRPLVIDETDGPQLAEIMADLDRRYPESRLQWIPNAETRMVFGVKEVVDPEDGKRYVTHSPGFEYRSVLTDRNGANIGTVLRRVYFSPASGPPPVVEPRSDIPLVEFVAHPKTGERLPVPDLSRMSSPQDLLATTADHEYRNEMLHASLLGMEQRYSHLTLRLTEDRVRYLSQRTDVIDPTGATRSTSTIVGFDFDARLFPDSGPPAGSIYRFVYRDEAGRIVVFNGGMELKKEARGQGFSTVFTQAMTNMYRQKGVDRTEGLAGEEDGGLAWALAGFDWNPDPVLLRMSVDNIRGRIDAVYDDASDSDKALLDGMRERFDGPVLGYPSPNELAILRGENT